MTSRSEIQNTSKVEYVYPKEYFYVQSAFAVKVLDLGIVRDIKSALLNYTVCYRNIVGHNPSRKGPDSKWIDFAKEIDPKSSTTESLTNIQWQYYTNQPHSRYSLDALLSYNNRFGSFVYKDEVDATTNQLSVGLHFINLRRGERKSDFSRLYISERFCDLRSLFVSINRRMSLEQSYTPSFVALESWMNCLPAVRSCLPPEFVQTETAVDFRSINFKSNSLWGQFLENSGNIHIRRMTDFTERLSRIKDPSGLLSCFTFPVTRFKCNLVNFFDFYISK